MAATDDVIPIMPLPDLLPEALRNLPQDRWRRFVWNYVFNGAQGAAAARAAGYPDSSEAAKVRACELLQRDEIVEAIDALTAKYLFTLAPRAVLRLSELLDNPKHPKHDKAISMVLGATGHGEKSTVEHKFSGSVTVNHTDAALEDLRRFKALNFTREQLLGIFGFSGLDRYEKMLAIADQRAGVSRENGPVIEHGEAKTDA